MTAEEKKTRAYEIILHYLENKHLTPYYYVTRWLAEDDERYDEDVHYQICIEPLCNEAIDKLRDWNDKDKSAHSHRVTFKAYRKSDDFDKAFWDEQFDDVRDVELTPVYRTEYQVVYKQDGRIESTTCEDFVSIETLADMLILFANPSFFFHSNCQASLWCIDQKMPDYCFNLIHNFEDQLWEQVGTCQYIGAVCTTLDGMLKEIYAIPEIEQMRLSDTEIKYV